jgi:hypothetical protein
MATWYVSPNGDDAHDGLTEETAVLNFHVLPDKAAGGDKICFLPGAHVLQWCPNDNAGGSIYNGLFDRGKSLEIYALKPSVTTISTAAATLGGAAYNYANLIGLGNAASVVRNLNLTYRERATPNIYDALEGYKSDKGAKIVSCNITVEPNIHWDDYSKQNWANCNFNAQAGLVAGHTGNSKFVNCIYPTPLPTGTKTYGLVRQATADDLRRVADDCRNLGDPAILNDDGTRSHIGIFGGPYGHLWVPAKYLAAVGGVAYAFDGTAWHGLGKAVAELTEADFDANAVDTQYMKKAFLSMLGDRVEIVKFGPGGDASLTLAVKPYPQIVRPVTSIDLSLARDIKRITADDDGDVPRLFSVDGGATWETFENGARKTVALAGDSTDAATVGAEGLSSAALAAVTQDMWASVIPPGLEQKKIMFLMLISGENRTRSITVLQDRHGHYRGMKDSEYDVDYTVNGIDVTFSAAVPEARVMYLLK